MTEKINGQGLRPADTARHATVGSRQAGGQPGAKPRRYGRPARGGGDTVSITHSGLLMSKLEELVQQHAGRRPRARRARSRTRSLRAPTRSTINAVADRLLRFERDVLG